MKRLEFGIADAKSFFEKVARPFAQQFQAKSSLQYAMNAAWALWHVHEWHWCDQYPNQGTRGKEYDCYAEALWKNNPDLRCLRHITNAMKHCNVRSALSVRQIAQCSGRDGVGGYVAHGGYGVGVAFGDETPKYGVFFDDGSEARWLNDVIQGGMVYWADVLGAVQIGPAVGESQASAASDDRNIISGPDSTPVRQQRQPLRL